MGPSEGNGNFTTNLMVTEKNNPPPIIPLPSEVISIRFGLRSSVSPSLFYNYANYQ